ncbi:MAG: hypothetical protein HY309_24400 [Pseudomonas fluorescens]|nr:hypothetical protein [Pseudomonas fluorescens]
MTKPILQWACRELCNGWVMIGVDVDLSAPGEPEALLGYRRAIYQSHFDECTDPVIEFAFVIAEMTYRVTRGLEGIGDAPTRSASRTHAFGA